MLESLRKKQLINIILNLKDREEHSFKGFNAEEKKFIIDKIQNQKGDKGFYIEVSNDKKKFRKLYSWWI